MRGSLDDYSRSFSLMVPIHCPENRAVPGLIFPSLIRKWRIHRVSIVALIDWFKARKGEGNMKSQFAIIRLIAEGRLLAELSSTILSFEALLAKTVAHVRSA